jgi:hypothetical protein
LEFLHSMWILFSMIWKPCWLLLQGETYAERICQW